MLRGYITKIVLGFSGINNLFKIFNLQMVRNCLSKYRIIPSKAPPRPTHTLQVVNVSITNIFGKIYSNTYEWISESYN